MYTSYIYTSCFVYSMNTDYYFFLTLWRELLVMASMMTFSQGTICSFLHLGQVCITFHGPVLSDHLG